MIAWFVSTWTKTSPETEGQSLGTGEKARRRYSENSPCLVPLLRAADAFRVTWSEPKISPWGLPGAEVDELSLRILYSPGKIPRTWDYRGNPSFRLVYPGKSAANLSTLDGSFRFKKMHIKIEDKKESNNRLPVRQSRYILKSFVSLFYVLWACAYRRTFPSWIYNVYENNIDLYQLETVFLDYSLILGLGLVSLLSPFSMHSLCM